MRQSEADAASQDQVDGGTGKLSPMKFKMTVEEVGEVQKHTGVVVQHLLLEPAIGGGAAMEPMEPTKPEMAAALQQRTPQKRLRSVDSSKFNRSARKSKNCATFYFKHLDTDGENQIGGGLSSQNDEDGLSEEPLSNDENLLDNELTELVATSEEDEEDEWLYTNNKFNSTVNVDVATEEVVTRSFGKCIVPQISISEDSVFERDLEGVEDNGQRKVNGNGKQSSSLVQLVSNYKLHFKIQCLMDKRRDGGGFMFIFNWNL